MSGIAIFIEGGGSLKAEQRVLRAGFDAFFRRLKEEAAAADVSFRLIMCGARDEAYSAFMNERRFEPSTHSLLLVDSEEVLEGTIKKHLVLREAHWNLEEVSDAELHAMVTTMETWIVSDETALHAFYGQHFKANQLPRNADLERVSKADVCRCLAAATKDCPAGVYHKMRHAPKILSRLNLDTVSRRCAHCRVLVSRVEEVLRA